MTNRRTLSLRREQLGELTEGELAVVAGASGLLCDLFTVVQQPTYWCPTWDCTGCYPVGC